MKASASKRGLLSACQWWSRPDVTYEESKPGSAAVAGSKFHAVMDAHVCEDDEALLVLPMPKPLVAAYGHAKAWLTKNKTPSMVSEVAFGFDYATGVARYHGHNEDRDYSWATETEFCGTLDIFDGKGIPQPDSIDVGDWKTGRSVEGVWPQMRINGAIAGKALGAKHVRLRVLHATAGALDEYQAEMDEMDIDGELELLRRDLARIPDAKAVASEACDKHFCPARKVCGAYQERNGFR